MIDIPTKSNPNPVEKKKYGKCLSYEKSNKRLSLDILDYTFIGHYPKNTRIKEVRQDLFASLVNYKIKKKDFFLLSSSTLKEIPNDTKIKSLNFENGEQYILGYKLKFKFNSGNRAKSIKKLYSYDQEFSKAFMEVAKEKDIDLTSIILMVKDEDIKSRCNNKNYTIEEIIHAYGNKFEILSQAPEPKVPKTPLYRRLPPKPIKPPLSLTEAGDYYDIICMEFLNYCSELSKKIKNIQDSLDPSKVIDLVKEKSGDNEAIMEVMENCVLKESSIKEMLTKGVMTLQSSLLKGVKLIENSRELISINNYRNIFFMTLQKIHYRLNNIITFFLQVHGDIKEYLGKLRSLLTDTKQEEAGREHFIEAITKVIVDFNEYLFGNLSRSLKRTVDALNEILMSLNEEKKYFSSDDRLKEKLKPPIGPPQPPIPTGPRSPLSLRGGIQDELKTLFTKKKEVSGVGGPPLPGSPPTGTRSLAGPPGSLIRDVMGGLRSLNAERGAPQAVRCPPPTGAPASPPATKVAPLLLGKDPSAPSASPPGAPSRASPASGSLRFGLRDEMHAELDRLRIIMRGGGDDIRPVRHDINLGLQYYSVMMEQQSYLFYVYFSHKKLEIQDEEGKVVYETTFVIETTKDEPPILDLKIKGAGFRVNPVSGRVLVDEEDEKPAIMIFSVSPYQSTDKKILKGEKKSEKRFLHVYIDFKGKNVNHTVLAITVQPKHFSLKLGPISLDLSKTQAMFISFIPVLIAVISMTYSIITLDPSSSGGGTLSGMIPGYGSIAFLITFLVTLLKKGVFPLKQKWSSFMDFGKSPAMLK